MLGDLRMLAAGDELLLDTERVALQGLFNMIRRFSIGYDVGLHKRTLERGLLSLVGPDAAWSPAPARCLRRARPCGRRGCRQRCRCARDPDRRGCRLVVRCRRCGRAASCARGRGRRGVSDAAVECLRVEHGRPRYGVDLDDSVIPQEAGLNERAVSFTKGCYVGRRPSPGCTTAGSRIGSCAGCGCPGRLRPGMSCRSRDGPSGRSPVSRCRRGSARSD